MNFYLLYYLDLMYYYENYLKFNKILMYELKKD